MVRTLNRIWPRHGKERYLLRPSDGGWEVWDFGSNGKPRFIENCADPSTVACPPASALALPLQHVFAVPLWLATTESSLFPDMIYAQLERCGLASRSRQESVMDYRTVATENGQTLVLACVLAPGLPTHLCLEKIEWHELSGRILPLPENQFTLWREGERLVLAATRGKELVYFQALGERAVTALVLQELNCIRSKLEAEKIITPLAGVTAWGEFPETEMTALGQGLGLTARNEPRPPPSLPDLPSNLTPYPVRQAQLARQKRMKVLQVIAVAAGLYTLAVVASIAHLGWLQFQAWSLQSGLAKNAETVQAIRKTAEHWQALQLAINPDLYPVEQLFQCASVLPPEGVRFTLFEQQGWKILIMGEAKNAQAAFKFADDLKKNPNLRGYHWEMPQPRLLPNDSAQFQIEGVHPHASTNQ